MNMTNVTETPTEATIEHFQVNREGTVNNVVTEVNQSK